MINEVLPIDGWEAYEVNCSEKGCTVKYKHRDMAFLLCPHDRLPGPTVHRRYTVKVRDLPLGIHRTTLEIEVLECWCYKCGKFHTVRPHELHYSMGMTWRLMWHISWLVKEGSVADVARSLGIPETTVRRANKAVLEVLDFLLPVKLDNLGAIVVDEKYLGRRLKFITVVTDRHGELLYIGKGKGKDALAGFFALLNDRQKDAIKVVGADRSNAYTKAVREHLPGADVCYDRFHIIKNANDAVTKVRRSEYKAKSKDTGDKETAKVLKGTRYLLLHDPKNLKEKGREKLDRVLSLNENINKAYILKEGLRHLYTLESPQEALEHFEGWLAMAAQSGLKPFVSMAQTLREQAAAVLGYFRHKLTSGVIEGVNSKIAKIQFQMRGITDIRYLYLKLRESTCKRFLAALVPVD